MTKEERKLVYQLAKEMNLCCKYLNQRNWEQRDAYVQECLSDHFNSMAAIINELASSKPQ